MRTLLLVLTTYLGLIQWTCAGDLKLGVLDLEKAVKDYWRTKEVETQMLDSQVSFEKEFQSLRLEGEARVKEIEQLQESTKDQALSVSTREQKQRDVESKVVDLRAFELRLDAFRRDGQSQLREKSSRLTRSLLQDIVQVAYDLGDKEGFDLILNVNRSNPAASDVLYARKLENLTSKVVAELDARRPVAIDAPATP
jgi:Skp family chaperone for outer membrane proteins